MFLYLGHRYLSPGRLKRLVTIAERYQNQTVYVSIFLSKFYLYLEHSNEKASRIPIHPERNENEETERTKETNNQPNKKVVQNANRYQDIYTKKKKKK